VRGKRERMLPRKSFGQLGVTPLLRFDDL